MSAVELRPVESSFITAVGYDPDARHLYVRTAAGHGYRYLGVPPGVFERMLAAESKGTFFNREVKTRYTWEAVTL